MNLQNIPRSDTTIKRAFIPKLGAFSFFDYQAVEPRLMAYYAAKIGHTNFAELIRSGIDPYTAVAKLITGKADVDPEERQRWKVMFLSLMYGGGVKTIQAQFGVERKEAYGMIDQFHENFPAVRALQDMVAAVINRRGYILGLDGRHYHVPEHGEHKMLNTLIQGSAAAVMKQATIRVHRWLDQSDFQSHIVSIVHDELILDGPVKDELAALHDVVPPLMVHEEVNEIVPVLVDHEVSLRSWADKESYDQWLAKQN